MFELRLQSPHRKLKGEPELLQEYDKIIQEQLQNSIVEKVPELNCSTDQNERSVHFPPHHAVVRKERNMTKVRIRPWYTNRIYDGSAKSENDVS